MRLKSRDIVFIMIRLRAAARRQGDGIMIGRLKSDAATVIVLEVKMAVAAIDIGLLVLFLPGEIGGGPADVCRGVRAVINGPVTDQRGNEPAEAGNAGSPHPDFDRGLLVTASKDH